MQINISIIVLFVRQNSRLETIENQSKRYTPSAHNFVISRYQTEVPKHFEMQRDAKPSSETKQSKLIVLTSVTLS